MRASTERMMSYCVPRNAPRTWAIMMCVPRKKRVRCARGLRSNLTRGVNEFSADFVLRAKSATIDSSPTCPNPGPYSAVKLPLPPSPSYGPHWSRQGTQKAGAFHTTSHHGRARGGGRGPTRRFLQTEAALRRSRARSPSSLDVTAGPSSRRLELIECMRHATLELAGSPKVACCFATRAAARQVGCKYARAV